MERLAAWYCARRIGKAAGLNRKERKQMANILKLILGSSWITTILGTLATSLGVSMVGWVKPDGTIRWLAVGLALVGYAASRAMKDNRLTGGTVSQPTVPNPPVLPPKEAALAPEPKV